jgi:hypothetical protein
VRRVPVGTPARFRSGLRARDALLADLSSRGCQLLGGGTLPVGRRVSVLLPDPTAPSRGFTVGGRVVRGVRGPGGEPGFAVEFDQRSPRTRARLEKVVAAHAAGPAAFEGREAVLAPAGRRDALIEAGATAGGTEAVAAEPAPDAAGQEPGVGGTDAALTDAEEHGNGDRRRSARRVYRDRRVVALGDEAARVLIGSDLSTGGMRVAANSSLRLGQRFRVALHGGSGDVPVVVDAEVLRDDGERGLVLAFQDLAAPVERSLARMLETLPLVEACRESAESIVVSEILDAEAS